MSYYRDFYLKSDDWKQIRAAKLAQGNQCCLCQVHSDSNDVHHVIYNNLKTVSFNNLKVLCRTCHTNVHVLLRKYPSMKKLGAKNLWTNVMAHLGNSRKAILARKTIQKRLERHAARMARRSGSLAELIR